MPNPMKDIYTRLNALGFKSKWVRAAILPDWWDDPLATIPSNRALAEAAISRSLKLPVKLLRNANSPLALPHLNSLRLKRMKTTLPSEIYPALVVGQRCAEVVAESMRDVPSFSGIVPALTIRNLILGRDDSVSLQSLLDMCWQSGIGVVHLRNLPGKKFEGMALFVKSRPMITLASGHDSPSKLLFHLAHELGHIMRQHVTADSEPLVDTTIDDVDDDNMEKEADTFALELLTGSGSRTLKYSRPMRNDELAEAALRIGRKHNIDPGFVALMYANSADRFGVAQLALRRLGLATGAHTAILSTLKQNLATEDLSESAARLLDHIALDYAAAS